MADWMLVPALRAFRRSDPTIVALSGQTGPDARITAIAAEFDAHIPAGATLAGGSNVSVPVIGHFRMLQHPARDRRRRCKPSTESNDPAPVLTATVP